MVIEDDLSSGSIELTPDPIPLRYHFTSLFDPCKRHLPLVEPVKNRELSQSRGENRVSIAGLKSTISNQFQGSRYHFLKRCVRGNYFRSSLDTVCLLFPKFLLSPNPRNSLIDHLNILASKLLQDPVQCSEWEFNIVSFIATKEILNGEERKKNNSQQWHIFYRSASCIHPLNRISRAPRQRRGKRRHFIFDNWQ